MSSLMTLGTLTSKAQTPPIRTGFLCSLNDNETAPGSSLCRNSSNSYISDGELFVFINKATDFSGEGLLPNELEWNKFMFK